MSIYKASGLCLNRNYVELMYSMCIIELYFHIDGHRANCSRDWFHGRQECENELTQKGEMVARLQTKASQIGNILQTLEKKYETKGEQQHHTGGNGHYAGDKANIISAPSSLSRRQLNLLKFEQMTQKKKQQPKLNLNPVAATSLASKSALKQGLHIKIEAIPPFNASGAYQKSLASSSSEHGAKVASAQLSPGDTNGYGSQDHELPTPLSAKSLKLNYEDRELDESLDATKSLQQMPSF